MKNSMLFKNIVLFLSRSMSSGSSEPRTHGSSGLWNSELFEKGAQEGLVP